MGSEKGYKEIYSGLLINLYHILAHDLVVFVCPGPLNISYTQQFLTSHPLLANNSKEAYIIF